MVTDEGLSEKKEMFLMGEKVKYVKLGNLKIKFEDAVEFMNDEIREELHSKLSPCTDQKFLSAYAKAHFKKFNKSFEFTYFTN